MPDFSPLKGKKIILGVCGSIAAYKAAVLVRLLVKAEAEVQVILTASASDFISPLTLATLSKRPALGLFQKDAHTGEWNNHVELGLWADAMLIAPATANTIAKMANGLCDSLLLATYLSARCPVMVAPAMDLDMFAHPSTTQNLARLQAFGHQIIAPGTGELASGLHGTGRMAEPEEIEDFLIQYFAPAAAQVLPLAGCKALVTAGPTREALDPVRFISNHSTGKMGYALAEALAAQGAQVTLVSGPVNLPTPKGQVQRIDVESAADMLAQVQARASGQHILVHAAAVADYTPRQVASQKIKKEGEGLLLELVKTADIAAETGRQLRPDQLHVGFALETHSELENAQGKLQKKNFDLIVLNSLNDAGAGFGHDTNKVSLIDRQLQVQHLPLMPKSQVAAVLAQRIAQLWAAKQGGIA